MKINFTKLYVNDQDKALKFYTETLGFIKKTDISKGQYRWLTIVSPENQTGVELVLELNSNPAVKTYQTAMFEQSTPAANFNVVDVQAEYQRLQALAVKFMMPATEVMPGVIIAMLDDTCGNLIQIQKTD
jgi:predicted enzyme related to lactoylglutathione lyase